MNKKNYLSKKVAAVVAGSLALLGMSNSTDGILSESPNLEESNSSHLEIPSNKQLKPQLVLRPNFINPEDSVASMHSSHSSHSSHRSHSSHYSSSVA